MFRKMTYVIGISAVLASLLLAACSPAAPAVDQAAVAIVEDYYAALNAGDVDAAMAFVAEDAVFANPTGYYNGAAEIRSGLVEGVITPGITFELTNFRGADGRIVYDYEVLMGAELLDSGSDGLTIVENGEIVFDGTERTEPIASEPAGEETNLELSQNFSSSRFGFSISIPENWLINEKQGIWLDFRWPYPGKADGLDVFSAYVDGQNLGIAAGYRAIPEEATLELAEQHARELMMDGNFFVCGDVSTIEVTSSEAITVGGEPGLLLQAPCTEADDVLSQVALVIHNGQTYWFVWQSDPANGPLPGEAFVEILETVEFN
jgi:hypothetical protein